MSSPTYLFFISVLYLCLAFLAAHLGHITHSLVMLFFSLLAVGSGFWELDRD
jgi:hypothetical protein